MSDHDLGAAIRNVFDSRHVASPGLDQRVVNAIPWEQRPAKRWVFRPRLAGGVAVGLAALLVVALAAPSLLSKLGLFLPSTNGSEIAYSLAAVDGNSVFVIQRGEFQRTGHEDNVLIESSDGGRTWSRRIGFDGVYDGMQMFGADGFLWAIDMSFPPCSSAPCGSPANTLIAYRTTDGGATWKSLPKPAFAAEDAFFLDASQGWAVAYGNGVIGIGNEKLYATTDGGQSWTFTCDLPLSQPTSMVNGVGDYRVTFSDPLTGWFVGNGSMYSSHDAGLTWQPLTFDAPAAVADWTVAPSQPVFKGQDGIIGIGYRNPNGADNATPTLVYFYVSSDGGRTWVEPRPAPDATAPVGDDWGPTYLGPGHVWLTSLSLSGGDNVQSGPAVARSSDGGRTWKLATHTPRILTMAFTDAQHGYGLDVSGPTNTNGIVGTSDGGATWYRVSVPNFS